MKIEHWKYISIYLVHFFHQTVSNVDLLVLYGYWRCYYFIRSYTIAIGCGWVRLQAAEYERLIVMGALIRGEYT